MSEFGKGFSYCLGLFLAHAERQHDDPSMWFNGAVDHLYELQIPLLMEGSREDIEMWLEKMYGFRNSVFGEYKVDKVDKAKALQYAKDLLLELDSKLNIECEKGDFE